MQLSNVMYSLKQFGLANTLLHSGYRVGEKTSGLLALSAMKLTPDRLNESYCSSSKPYRFGFLEPEHLQAYFHQDPAILNQAIVDKAVGNGDVCFAAVDGDRLASFGWYSRRPTHLRDELVLRYANNYAYMYHGYTYPHYRGARLHAICMAKALLDFARQGLFGFVSVVEVNNFRSLRSCERLGYRLCGTLVAIKARGKNYAYASNKSRTHGFAIEKTRNVPEVITPAVPGIAQQAS